MVGKVAVVPIVLSVLRCYMFVPRDVSERSLSECNLTEIAYHIYKLEGPVDQVRPRAFFAAERALRRNSKATEA